MPVSVSVSWSASLAHGCLLSCLSFRLLVPEKFRKSPCVFPCLSTRLSPSLSPLSISLIVFLSVSVRLRNDDDDHHHHDRLNDDHPPLGHDHDHNDDCDCDDATQFHFGDFRHALLVVLGRSWSPLSWVLL